MNQQDLFKRWNGQKLDFDGAYGAQCVDIVKQYFQDVLGMEPFNGNVIDYWNKEVPGFRKIKNTSFVYPKPGDILIWNIGQYGHISICNWVRTFDIGVFEQNNPVGSPCHFQTQKYKNLIGWLRPINPPVEAPRPQTNERINVKMVYVSDTDDIAAAVAYCDYKLQQFTGGRLGIEYSFKKIHEVYAPDNQDLDQWAASNLVEKQTYDKPFHWAVLGHYGSNTSPGYSTYTSMNKGIWMTQGYKPFPKEVLLFELKHFCVKFYNQHRGTNPYIENYDNYKSADGGLAKVEEQIKQLIPYLSVFKL